MLMSKKEKHPSLGRCPQGRKSIMVMKTSERKDSTPRHARHKPAALPLSYVPKGVAAGFCWPAVFVRRFLSDNHICVSHDNILLFLNRTLWDIFNFSQKIVEFFFLRFHPYTWSFSQGTCYSFSWLLQYRITHRYNTTAAWSVSPIF